LIILKFKVLSEIMVKYGGREMSSGVVGYLSRQPSLDEFNYFNSEYFLIVGIFWGRFFSAIMKWEVLFPTAPSLTG
jgi:hypothetical protein